MSTTCISIFPKAAGSFGKLNTFALKLLKRIIHASFAGIFIHKKKALVEFSVPNRAEMIHHIRERVSAFACTLPFSNIEIDDLCLAVGEAAANAIRHGSSSGACKIGVKMEISNYSVIITVSDKGCGFNLSEVINRDITLLSEGGRGIAFMRFLVDNVEFKFRNPGTDVILTKTVKAKILNKY